MGTIPLIGEGRESLCLFTLMKFFRFRGTTTKSQKMDADATCSVNGCEAPKNWKDLVKDKKLPIMGDEKIMSQKKHGTSETPVMDTLKYGVDRNLADRICNYNRHYAENFGYFQKTKWLEQVSQTEATGNGDGGCGASVLLLLLLLLSCFFNLQSSFASSTLFLTK